MNKKLINWLAIFALLPATAMAHTEAGAATGFAHGAFHPLGGLDHLLAMVAVGLWAVQYGGRAIWVMPCMFVGSMILGGVLGYFQLALPYVEVYIVMSVLVLGVLILGAFKLPPVVGASLIGLFGIFHGNAHGFEMPANVDVRSYILGFVIATTFLHIAGIAAGLSLKKLRLDVGLRLIGAAIAFSGLYLSVA